MIISEIFAQNYGAVGKIKVNIDPNRVQEDGHTISLKEMQVVGDEKEAGPELV